MNDYSVSEKVLQKEATDVPVIILEDAKFLWKESEIRLFIILWEKGNTVWEIARKMKEKPDDIALLIIDQAQKGIIKHGN